jgi:integral membrane protein
MSSTSNKTLSRFLQIGRAEGLSFLLLIFIAMPFKYALGQPLLVKYLGWIHGLLLMLYVVQLMRVAYEMKWDVLKIIYSVIAALLPFGPFVWERQLKKDQGNLASK